MPKSLLKRARERAANVHPEDWPYVGAELGGLSFLVLLVAVLSVRACRTDVEPLPWYGLLLFTALALVAAVGAWRSNRALARQRAARVLQPLAADLVKVSRDASKLLRDLAADQRSRGGEL
ncbi:hypothetical protein [Actinoplanes sp. URMC 104]|uniref:hypothetical protein n=1 Tax=Actinoplanes sp. URMC 104 TaxID=3423409 RepID=UPI003F1A8FA5